MGDQVANLADLGTGLAVMTTCIVQELSRADPTFEERFLARLGKAQMIMCKRNEGEGYAVDLLAQTHSLLTGFSLRAGQGKSFIAD